MANKQEKAVDEALRVALRVIGERADLVARMAEDCRRGKRTRATRMYEQCVDEDRHYAEVLRHALVRSRESVRSEIKPAGDAQR